MYPSYAFQRINIVDDVAKLEQQLEVIYKNVA